MVSVDERTHATLRALAAEMGVPIQEGAATAVEHYRRKRMLEDTKRIYIVAIVPVTTRDRGCGRRAAGRQAHRCNNAPGR